MVAIMRHFEIIGGRAVKRPSASACSWLVGLGFILVINSSLPALASPEQIDFDPMKGRAALRAWEKWMGFGNYLVEDSIGFYVSSEYEVDAVFATREDGGKIYRVAKFKKEIGAGWVLVAVTIPIAPKDARGMLVPREAPCWFPAL